MLGPTHKAFATTTMSSILLMTPKKETIVDIIICISISWICATLPDMDKHLPEKYHRTWTHALWIPFILAYCCYHSQGMIQTIIFAILVSYMSHLIGDAYSKAGIAWLYPFQTYIYKDDGGFYVKGKRGIFIPLYTVGKSKIPWKLLWYILTVILLIILMFTS